jgi:hypothetical protein
MAEAQLHQSLNEAQSQLVEASKGAAADAPNRGAAGAAAAGGKRAASAAPKPSGTATKTKADAGRPSTAEAAAAPPPRQSDDGALVEEVCSCSLTLFFPTPITGRSPAARARYRPAAHAMSVLPQLSATLSLRLPCRLARQPARAACASAVSATALACGHPRCRAATRACHAATRACCGLTRVHRHARAHLSRRAQEKLVELVLNQDRNVAIAIAKRQQQHAAEGSRLEAGEAAERGKARAVRRSSVVRPAAPPRAVEPFTSPIPKDAAPPEPPAPPPAVEPAPKAGGKGKNVGKGKGAAPPKAKSSNKLLALQYVKPGEKPKGVKGWMRDLDARGWSKKKTALVRAPPAHACRRARAGTRT